MKVILSDNGLRALYNFRLDVINHFVRKGYDVVVTFPQCTYEEDYAVRFPEECRLVPLEWAPVGTSVKKDFSYFLRLLKFYHSEKPDIIFHYSIKPNLYGTFAAWLCGIPSVAMVAGLGYVFEGDGMTKRIVRGIYRIALRKADWVIALNRENYEFLQEEGFVTERSELFGGGEGVNLESYSGRRRRFERVSFILMTRLLYDKGYAEYVAAAAMVREKYPDVKFFVLGPTDFESPMGVPESRLKNDIAGGDIEYLGYSHDVKQYLDKDGVVSVLPSYHEGLSRTLMESVALGLPIITTDIAGCRETVDDGVNGYLVKPKDSHSLAAAMERFISLSEEEKSAMSLASLEMARRKFDVRNVLSKYDRIISTLSLTF